MHKIKDQYAEAVEKLLKPHVKGTIRLETPPSFELGDYAFGCFELAKELKKAPAEIAQDIAKQIKLKDPIKKVEVEGPYVNFFINKKILAENTLKEISKKTDNYGSQQLGKGKNIVIDYSSPNIAKPFGIGHLRSTVIGNSLKHILKFLGYKVIAVNHLGDWGTQFGKLIVAFREWGVEAELMKSPITHLFSLYVKFHEEAKIDPELENRARMWFKRLEDGNKDALQLWELFRKLSLDEFKKYYSQLEIEFDTYHGEAFYNDKTEDAIKLIEGKKITEISEDALVVMLEDQKPEMPPLLLRKSDGATTYSTRDLAAVFYRMMEYDPEKIIYVVGSPQKLHFNQLFTVLEKLGHKKELFEHVDFGLIKFKDAKMSTRKGNIIFLEEVLDKAIELARKIIKEKNPDLYNKNEIAHIVGIGAVIFGDLCNDRIRDVDFDWDRVLSFEGETAPYIQYTHARAGSVLRKSGLEGLKNIDYGKFQTTHEQKLIVKLNDFQKTIVDSANHYKPHIIANYLIELSQLFNEFYQKCPILKNDENDDDLILARLALTAGVKQVIKNGMSLLGIKVPEEM
ncbi:arginine--tRNA ligase [Nanoarchaeota archaeon]